MKSIILVLFLSCINYSCQAQENEKNVKNTTSTLLLNIQKADSESIYKMVSSNISLKELKNGFLKNDISFLKPYLDSFDLNKGANYHLGKNSNNPGDYIIVKLFLRENENESTWVEVYFTANDVKKKNSFRNLTYYMHPKKTIDLNELPTQQE
jgi:hypothetical protein